MKLKDYIIKEAIEKKETVSFFIDFDTLEKALKKGTISVSKYKKFNENTAPIEVITKEKNNQINISNVKFKIKATAPYYQMNETGRLYLSRLIQKNKQYFADSSDLKAVLSDVVKLG